MAAERDLPVEGCADENTSGERQEVRVKGMCFFSFAVIGWSVGRSIKFGVKDRDLHDFIEGEDLSFIRILKSGRSPQAE